MSRPFAQVIRFQVRPDRLDAFEALIAEIQPAQARLPGCLSAKYVKRFYTFDGVEGGQPPRELTKIVKCVKYYAYLEFDTIENCGLANGWFFENYAAGVIKTLIVPFDMENGYTL